MKKIFFSLALFSTVAAAAADYTFVRPDRHWHIQSDVRAVAPAEMRTHSVKHSKLKYLDSNTSLFYSHSLNPDNSLSWQIGYDYLRLDWKDNPRFNESDFHNLVGSLAWLSTSTNKWRWILNGGFTVDTKTFNFVDYAVYYGLMWGRYQFRDNVGIHVGAFAYYGIKNGYALPILGADWWISRKWKLTAVFPVDVSLSYQIAQNWSTDITYSSFGGPYRLPRRAHHGHGRYHHAIFEVYATGADWNLECNYNVLKAGIGVGYNFGGWLFIRSSNNHHGKYFKYDSAPYGQAYLQFTF